MMFDVINSKITRSGSRQIFDLGSYTENRKLGLLNDGIKKPKMQQAFENPTWFIK